MRILVFSGNYPSRENPAYGVFVHETIRGISQLGHEIVVISPRKFHPLKKSSAEDLIDDIRVLYPEYCSFSNIKIPGGLNTLRLNSFFLLRKITNLFPSIIEQFKPDLCYAHFLYNSGNAAFEFYSYTKVPYILSLGESNIDKYNVYDKKRTIQIFSHAKAIITVTHLLKQKIIDNWSVLPEKIYHIPNGIDPEKFLPINKVWAREQLNLPQKVPILIFVGHFNHRKGPDRVLKAVLQHNLDVKLIFLGKGFIPLESEKILYKGIVDHSQLPLYLSSSDIFVLPTLAEGMPNAILEAIACGLPIISSDLSFNHEFLNEECSVLIDPKNVDELGRTIRKLVNDEKLLSKMSKASVELSKEFTIKKRIQKISGLFD